MSVSFAVIDCGGMGSDRFLQGTLGGILAEQGHFAGAAPLLRECRQRSPALLDQAACSLYLAMAARSGGDAREARRLAKQATILHAAPWLVAKAKRLLQGSDLPAASGSP